MRNLKKLGNGWTLEDNSIHFHNIVPVIASYICQISETISFRAVHTKEGWVLVRLENMNATNGLFFPSLKQLVAHLAS